MSEQSKGGPHIVYVVINTTTCVVYTFSSRRKAEQFVESKIWPQNYDIVECEVDA